MDFMEVLNYDKEYQGSLIKFNKSKDYAVSLMKTYYDYIEPYINIYIDNISQKPLD